MFQNYVSVQGENFLWRCNLHDETVIYADMSLNIQNCYATYYPTGMTIKQFTMEPNCSMDNIYLTRSIFWI